MAGSEATHTRRPKAIEVSWDFQAKFPSARQLSIQFKVAQKNRGHPPYDKKFRYNLIGKGEPEEGRFVVCFDEERTLNEIRLEVLDHSRENTTSQTEERILGSVTLAPKEIGELISQSIGFRKIVDLHFPLGPDCAETTRINLQLRVIEDVTKSLLKYHPEVAINTQLDVEHLLEALAIKKATLPFWRWASLGMLSGAWMAIAGAFAISVAGSIVAAGQERFPVLPRLILGLLAPVAMHFIVIFGGEFFSGNCMFMTVGLLKKRISLRSFLYVLLGSLMWNTIGCILFVFLFGRATDIFNAEPQLSFIRQVAASKANMDFGTTFARAIPANIMICVSIHMGISARDMLGKLVALHFPLTVYTVAGFEHSIGNLVIVPLGAMYGGDVDIVRFMWANLLPAILGNFIGGAFVGLADVILFSWDNGTGNTNQAHNHLFDRPMTLYQTSGLRRKSPLAGPCSGTLRPRHVSAVESMVVNIRDWLGQAGFLSDWDLRQKKYQQMQ